MDEIALWDQFEVKVAGPHSPNPYLNVQFGAEFKNQHRSIRVNGFYDGDGIYKVRLMPDTVGDWSYSTVGNRPELEGKTGRFRCTSPRAGSHGPVQVANTFHFAYADGAPYIPIGTTCYAWAHQGSQLEAQTLSTLRTAPFNKLRMCIFPKSYVYNENEPEFYPFPRDAAGANDFSAFNPAFFQHLERLIEHLRDLNIEADLILFHPYDRWGYANMPGEVDARYLRYVIARFAAYRNVWWSVANEFDLMKHKKMADWDGFFRIIQENDPHGHLRSIHHSKVIYDHSRPWVTHVSIQDDKFTKTQERLQVYRKPLVYDECKYEGNIPRRWGDVSAQELVRRFWLGFTSGAYVGHGETYRDPNDILWWSKGGVLRGQSPQRIAFLRKILDEAPPGGLNQTSDYYHAVGQPGKYYLYYFDLHQPKDYVFELDRATYRADLIDPWEMTVTPIEGRHTDKFKLKLPGRPYLAVRFTNVAG